MTAGPSTGGVIYGVRLVARSGRKTPFYDWLRKHDGDGIVVDDIDHVQGLEELGMAEIFWIEALRREGHPLLNLSLGGLGPMGVEWTAEMREAAKV